MVSRGKSRAGILVQFSQLFTAGGPWEVLSPEGSDAYVLLRLTRRCATASQTPMSRHYTICGTANIVMHSKTES